jgi:hypothetical protein
MDVFIEQQHRAAQQPPRPAGAAPAPAQKEKEMLDTFARVLVRDQIAEEDGLRLLARDVVRCITRSLRVRRRASLAPPAENAEEGANEEDDDTDDDDDDLSDVDDEASVLGEQLCARLPHGDLQHLVRTLAGSALCSLLPECDRDALEQMHADTRSLAPCGGALVQPRGDCFVHAYIVHHPRSGARGQSLSARLLLAAAPPPWAQIHHLHLNPAKRPNEQILAYAACFANLSLWREAFGAQNRALMLDAFDTFEVGSSVS